MAAKEISLRVGILGVTGAVGQKFVSLLEGHPWFRITALAASARSSGKAYGDAVTWREAGAIPESVKQLMVRDATPENMDCDFVFSGLDAAAATDVEPLFAAAGIPVISNARSWRMHRNVPLIIPEINPDHARLTRQQHWGERDGFIATTPNCSTVGLAMALKPLQDAFGIRAVSVVTLQALSGAGYPGPSAIDLLGNVIPNIDGEEEKLAIEPGKILGRCTSNGVDPAPFVVSAHCNRVPVLDGHLLCVSVRLESHVSVGEVARALGDFLTPEIVRGLPSCPERSIVVMPESDRPQPRRDSGAGGGMTVSIGRVRHCETHDVKFTALVHNTVRGAAGGALLCAELLARENYLDQTT